MTQAHPSDSFLPCPFCGPGMSVVETVLSDQSGRWQVFCGACGSSSGSTKTEAEAIATWNRRGGGITGEVRNLALIGYYLMEGRSPESGPYKVVWDVGGDRASLLEDAIGWVSEEEPERYAQITAVAAPGTPCKVCRGTEYALGGICWACSTANTRAALAAPGGEGEVETQFEVWQGDDFVAGADTLSDAQHYAVVYGQDGPVEIKVAVTTRYRFADWPACLAAPPEPVAWRPDRATIERAGLWANLPDDKSIGAMGPLDAFEAGKRAAVEAICALSLTAPSPKGGA